MTNVKRGCHCRMEMPVGTQASGEGLLVSVGTQTPGA